MAKKDINQEMKAVPPYPEEGLIEAMEFVAKSEWLKDKIENPPFSNFKEFLEENADDARKENKLERVDNEK
jgi:hypothetical protein